MPDRERGVVVNTSPLVYLHMLSRLSILHDLFGAVIVPEAVRDEVARGMARGKPGPDLCALAWLDVRAPRDRTLIPALADLGGGEAEAIALARERTGSLLIIDDRLARRVAAVAGVTFTGTAGLLVLAKREGLVPAVAPLLDALVLAGLWLSESVRETVLRSAGELPGGIAP